MQNCEPPLPILSEDERESSADSTSKEYVSPRLTHYGDLRTLTLGGSPGTGDSGPTVGIRFPL